MIRSLDQKRADIIRLGYCVSILWERLHPNALDGLDEMNWWCDNHFGREGYAWASDYTHENESTSFWFVCPEHAFEFKMRFG